MEKKKENEMETPLVCPAFVEDEGSAALKFNPPNPLQ